MNQPNYPKDKAAITVAVLRELEETVPNHTWENVQLDSLIHRWWTSGRSGTGLQLTFEGGTALALANIEYTDVQCEPEEDLNGTKLWTQFYSTLRKKLKCPWCIESNGKIMSIRIFDNKISTFAVLHGNLISYLRSQTE